MKSRTWNIGVSSGLISIFLALSPLNASEVENFESLEVLNTVLPEYPVRLAYEGIYAGSARLVISVDGSGKLTDVFEESYSHPEIGRLANKYIRKWTFRPAKLNGEPITSVKPIDFYFDDKRGVYSIGVPEAAASYFVFGDHLGSKRIYNAEELDRELEPVTMENALYPRALKDSGVDGMAVVTFYVDEKGRVRMPHTTDYSHISFGESALSTVKEWRFKPPTVNGKPVSIHVQQRFNFKGTER